MIQENEYQRTIRKADEARAAHTPPEPVDSNIWRMLYHIAKREKEVSRPTEVLVFRVLANPKYREVLLTETITLADRVRAGLNAGTLKMCLVCGEIKPLNRAHWYTDRTKVTRANPEGFEYACKECSREASRKRQRARRGRSMANTVRRVQETSRYRRVNVPPNPRK